MWDSGGRWDKLLYAGAKDTHAPTIFDRVLRKEIPSTTVFEDEDVLVFHDIHPQVSLNLALALARSLSLSLSLSLARSLALSLSLMTHTHRRRYTI